MKNQMEAINVSQMLSIAKIKTVLEKDGSVYTPDEILLIRDFLYTLAEKEFSIYIKEKRRDLEFKLPDNDNPKLEEAA